MSHAQADVRSSDLFVATLLTVAVFAGSLFALAHSRLEHRAELPAIDPGLGIPIAVRPVADLPGGGGSGKQVGSAAGKPAVPRAWRRKVPRAKPATTMPELPWTELSDSTDSTDPTEPTPTAEPTPTNEALPRHRARQPTPNAEPLPDVAPRDPDDPPLEPEPNPNPELPDIDADADPSEAEGDPNANPDQPGEGSEAAEGGDASGDGGDGDGDGGGGGGIDPLLARAIAFYRARLVAWFSSRFHVSGSGLSKEKLAKYRVRVHIEVGEDLRIVNYQVLSSDHPAFEQAAHATMEKLRGASLPAPPENYPGAVQRQLTVTFTCAEDACD